MKKKNIQQGKKPGVQGRPNNSAITFQERERNIKKKY